MSPPERVVVVLGTGTGVGKTFVTAALLRSLRDAGLSVAVRKPVQSFSEEEATGTDAHVLGAASDEDATSVCPPHRWYAMAMAPPMAAERLRSVPFTVSELVEETRWPKDVEVGLVETVGGVRSPAAADGDSLALAAAFAPAMLVLVADAGLGCINAVRLCRPFLASLSTPAVVLLNRFDPDDDLHRRNLAYLRADGLDPVVDIESLTTTVKARLMPSR